MQIVIHSSQLRENSGKSPCVLNMQLLHIQTMKSSIKKSSALNIQEPDLPTQMRKVMNAQIVIHSSQLRESSGKSPCVLNMQLLHIQTMKSSIKKSSALIQEPDLPTQILAPV